MASEKPANSKKFISHLVPLELTFNERRTTVLTNIVKMLINRKHLDINKYNDEYNPTKIDNSKVKPVVDKLASSTDDSVYKIKLDTNIVDESGDTTEVFIAKIVNQKITAINKTSGIVQHLEKFSKYANMLVVLDINNKPRQYIANNFPKTELFLEKELMINLVDSIIVPSHELLSKTESENVIKEYNALKKNMPKIFSTDAVARYYNMQPGYICRILRPSETASLGPFYRIVVRGIIK
jgi:DNA-directed RNA polymerase subunit H (RpoH/RPB5)